MRSARKSSQPRAATLKVVRVALGGSSGYCTLINRSLALAITLAPKVTESSDCSFLAGLGVFEKACVKVSTRLAFDLGSSRRKRRTKPAEEMTPACTRAIANSEYRKSPRVPVFGTVS